MNYYLVDYENIHSDLEYLLKDAIKGDTIVLFYSDVCKNISLDVISDFTSRNLRIACYKVVTGTKNALDFQLASHLGYLVGEHKKAARYYIVSNDKGYDCLCKHWESLGISVERISRQISEVKVNQPKKSNNKKQKDSASDNDNNVTLEEVKAIVKDKDAEFIVDVINNSNAKTEVHDKLSKHYKNSQKSGSLYKKIKPLFKGKFK